MLLGEADFRSVNFSSADLSETELSRTNLLNAELYAADLSRSNLYAASLIESDLREARLYRANLEGACLNRADLRFSDFSRSCLVEASLAGANLTEADFYQCDLSKASLSRTHALRTNFARSTFTGAYLQDWNINCDTDLDGVICDYVLLSSDSQGRRPRQGTFMPDEFSALFQKALDTVDLIFKDGIDWQAFFQSFQELRGRYSDQDLNIQAIEKKGGGAFVIRLEVPPELEKSSIESDIKALYESKLVLLEHRYRAELNAKNSEISAYKEQSTNMVKISELLAGKFHMSEGSKFDLRGAQFAGGFAETVQGDQVGGAVNNYSANLDEVIRLITSSRALAESFPAEQEEDINIGLNDLEVDVKSSEPDQNRITRRLKQLVAVAITLCAATGGAATLSTNAKTFTDNILELARTLDIPIEEVQPIQAPSSESP